MSGKITKAHQMPTPHVLNNQRVPSYEQEPKVSFRDRRPGMSPRHLELIRRLDCSVCNERHQLHAHHLRHGQAGKERGVYLKSTDRWAVPLCRFHHDEIHRIATRYEAQFFQGKGIASQRLAAALWNNTGNQVAMQGVVTAFKQHARAALSRMAQVNSLVAHKVLTRAEAEEQVEWLRK